MAREFKILDKEYVDWLFLDSKAHSTGYISYRQVIEHGLFRLLHHTSIKIDKSKCKEWFTAFKESFDKNKDYEDELFLKLYHLKNEGVLIIDTTKWCFPLVFIENRVDALKMALKNIEREIDSILSILEQADSWDRELQEKLDQFDDRKQNKTNFSAP